MKLILSDDNFNLLKKCIISENPSILITYDKLNYILSSYYLEEYIDVVSNVFCNKGVNEYDEPNEFGYKLKCLIDSLTNYYDMINQEEWKFKIRLLISLLC